MMRAQSSPAGDCSGIAPTPALRYTRRMTVRTRFAPSPTGMLHIGGARTALFNYLFARHHGGAFLLRIEDTDRERSTKEATQVILDGLAWLGLDPDEPPVFQSARQARHVEVAMQMLAAGRAYRCFCTPEELREMRERALAEGRPPRYDGRWRDRDPAEAPPGVAPAIRLRAPREGETVVHDRVQGDVRVANSELDDMIILRSDGTPTYLHAVVVDDHDMAITHVIRGDDHLTNTFRQLQIYHAMGWQPPEFAHIPLILGADGTKLSKRHGAVSLLEFREQGFLPEALCNYLLRLGWAHGDAEIISREEAIRLFDLDGVGRAASRMDYAKLTHINGVWLRAADNERLTEEVLRRLAHRTELALGTKAMQRIRMLMPELKERAKTLVELADSAAFLAHPVPLPMQPKAAALLTPEVKLMLRELARALAATDFSVAAVDAALRAFAESHGMKLGQVAQPLRAALTGSTTSPPIDATVAALGREEVLARIAAIH
jgi:glutamyl-tRNA synthetase